MVLKLKGTTELAIAIRHAVNRLNDMVAGLEGVANENGHVYIKKIIGKGIDSIHVVQANLTKYNEQVDHGEKSEARTIADVGQEKAALDKAIADMLRELIMRQEELKRLAYRKKIEKCIHYVTALMNYNLFTTIENSRSAKAKKVEQLGEGVPTYDAIYEVLRTPELNYSFMVRTRKQLFAKDATKLARKLQQKLDDAKAEGDQNADFDFSTEVETAFDNVLEDVSEDTLSESQTVVSRVLEPGNADNAAFVSSTLPKSNKKFFATRNRNIFRNHYTETVQAELDEHKVSQVG